jgi:hypothetical protein
MKATNHQSILIVEPDDQFREEMVNFLFSAGYEKAEATESLAHRKANALLPPLCLIHPQVLPHVSPVHLRLLDAAAASPQELGGGQAAHAQTDLRTQEEVGVGRTDPGTEPAEKRLIHPGCGGEAAP